MYSYYFVYIYTYIYIYIYVCVCIYVCVALSVVARVPLFFFSLAFCIRECGSALGEL